MKPTKTEYYKVSGGVAVELEETALGVKDEDGIWLKPEGENVVTIPPAKFGERSKPRRVVLYPEGRGAAWPLARRVIAEPKQPTPADFKTIFGEYAPNLLRRALQSALEAINAKMQPKDWVIAIGLAVCLLASLAGLGVSIATYKLLKSLVH